MYVYEVLSSKKFIKSVHTLNLFYLGKGFVYWNKFILVDYISLDYNIIIKVFKTLHDVKMKITNAKMFKSIKFKPTIYVFNIVSSPTGI